MIRDETEQVTNSKLLHPPAESPCPGVLTFASRASYVHLRSKSSAARPPVTVAVIPEGAAGEVRGCTATRGFFTHWRGGKKKRGMYVLWRVQLPMPHTTPVH